MDNGDKRHLYRGFGDSLALAVEFVGAPALFALFGHLLDGTLGTGSLFTVGLAVFAFVGTVVRSYYAYEAAMKQHEAAAPWSRGAAPQPRSHGL